jgi:putative hydrolase of the HAD superfamily
MKPRAITFDAAQTLVDVHWNPGRFAVERAMEAGLALDEGHSQSVYERLLQGRWRDYQEINCTRDPVQCDAFWDQLTADWLKHLGQDESFVTRISNSAREVLYSKESPVFQLYPDTLPVLTSLKEEGIRLGIISNWDYSLHRILRIHESYDLFDVVVASLEEGVEKPDPRLFHLSLERMGAQPSETVHVGDSPLDDIQGARAAGMRAILIDRSLQHPAPGVITSLHQLREAIGWTD